MNNPSHDINFSLCPHYDKYELTEAQMVDIAKIAVRLAKDEMEGEGYQGWKKQIAVDIGTTVIDKLKTTFLWMLGGIALLIYVYLDKHDLLDRL
jgi:predicted RNA-binding protein with EMAP domain